MRTLNLLIDQLISYFPWYKVFGACICDILNHMHDSKIISFKEMQFLEKFIAWNIELSLMDEIIETSNCNLLAEILNSLKD